MVVEYGLDVLLNCSCKALKSKCIGLITNHTGVNTALQSNIDLLHSHLNCNLVALFGPEHGVRGDVAAGEHIASSIDNRTGLPIYSLYGDNMRPTSEMLRGIDALVFDILDVGCRYYTFAYTMAYTMQAAAQYGIPYYVLDRPNPATGTRVEGNVLRPGFESLVGLYPLAMRHGLTIGELARLINVEFHIGCDLTVVPMHGWKREMWWSDTGNTWVMPSPNAPTSDFAIVYPGTCLFEGTNLSEGRGTTKPFQVIGAPYISAEEWAEEINDLRLAGVRFRPVYFTPSISKHQGLLCGGVEVHITDREVFEPIRTALEMIVCVRQLYPQSFAWLQPQNNRYFFDSLAGTDQLRLDIERGISPKQITSSWQVELEAFKTIRNKYLLY